MFAVLLNGVRSPFYEKGFEGLSVFFLLQRGFWGVKSVTICLWRETTQRIRPSRSKSFVISFRRELPFIKLSPFFSLSLSLSVSLSLSLISLSLSLILSVSLALSSYIDSTNPKNDRESPLGIISWWNRMR